MVWFKHILFQVYTTSIYTHTSNKGLKRKTGRLIEFLSLVFTGYRCWRLSISLGILEL